MDKRALLAVVLSMLVLYVYQAYFIPMPVQRDEKAAVTQGKGDGGMEVTEESVKERAVIENASMKSEASEANSRTAGPVMLEEYPYLGRKFEAVFSNLGGGGLKNLKLMNYRESIEEGSPRVEMVRIEKGDPLPLSVSFEGSGLDIPVDAVFKVTEKKKDGLSYSWTSENGVTVTRRYLFHPDEYRIDMEISVENGSNGKVKGKLGINLFERDSGKDAGRYSFSGFVARVDGELEKKSFGDLKKKGEKVIDGSISWMALEDKYFITAVLPDEKESAGRVKARWVEENLFAAVLEKNGLSVPAGERKTLAYSIYIGPKDIYLLREMGASLDDALELGWFHAIAEPLLRFLKFIYSFTGNYGYAIILITVLIKIVFFPLANKSYRSMKEMQKLQPKMVELREKYKDDRERMSREMMELYRKHRVNPLGGRLTMIVQIPVFIALYNVLMNAIELRHAPFHFWIADLSAKDPYYVTPILMGATMFIQQKMSPSAPDPAQQRIMMMMPFIFTFMFMNLPSGLVLYWLVNNVLSIAQQHYVMKEQKG